MLKLAVTAFIDGIDISAKLATADKALPRYFLGYLFHKIKKYDLALKFFRQAETLAISSEGKSSVLALMASLNIALIGLLALNNRIFAKSGIDRFDREKDDPFLIQHALPGQNYELNIIDS